MKAPQRYRHNGFTLLEVLVALAIFAICVSTLLSHSGQATRQAQLLETRTLASWIAKDKLDALRLDETPPPTGEKIEEVELASRRWLVTTTTSTTSTPTLFRVVVAVSEKSANNDQSQFTLTSFIGSH